jgi:2,3-bisphosphoglycerate-dependent phosphoglycerate mutase
LRLPFAAVPDFVLIRHGESVYNEQNRLNGDPSVPVRLSDVGRAQCSTLTDLFSRTSWGSGWTTDFPRTKESLAIIAPTVAAKAEPLALLNDIDVGIFEGRSITEFRAWRKANDPNTTPPDGESLEDVVDRYARGLLWLIEYAPRPALVVTHDQPIRYLMNALSGDDPISGILRKVPNAVPYPFSTAALTLGAQRLRDHRIE